MRRDRERSAVTETSTSPANPGVAGLGGEWCRIFEDRVATVIGARSLPCLEAERAAYEIVLVVFLNVIITHPNIDLHGCA